MGRRKINDCERGSEAPQVLYSPLSYGDNLHYEKFADGSVKCIEDEIPFDLPDGWAWAKINTIAFVTKLAGFEYTKNIAPGLCEAVSYTHLTLPTT